MDVEFKQNSTGFSIECSNLDELSSAVISGTAKDLASVLQNMVDSVADLEDSDTLETGQKQATLAQILKLQLLVKQLRDKSDLLGMLTSGDMTASDAGFPEFEVPGY